MNPDLDKFMNPDLDCAGGRSAQFRRPLGRAMKRMTYDSWCQDRSRPCREGTRSGDHLSRSSEDHLSKFPAHPIGCLQTGDQI